MKWGQAGKRQPTALLPCGAGACPAVRRQRGSPTGVRPWPPRPPRRRWRMSMRRDDATATHHRALARPPCAEAADDGPIGDKRLSDR